MRPNLPGSNARFFWSLALASLGGWLIAMTLSDGQLFLAGWLGATSCLSFGLFGYDKWRAVRNGNRVAESTLCLVCALGGWPGGLLGLLLFRHKTSKTSFKVKFAGAFVIWALGLWAAGHFAGRMS